MLPIAVVGLGGGEGVVAIADRTARRWANLGASSRLILDLAAGRPTGLERLPTPDELTATATHGLLGVMALSDEPLIAAAARVPYSRLAARQSAMEGVVGEILEVLAEREVPATVVKGPALARWAYENRGHRTFSDIDLVVPPDRVDDALRALEDFPRTVGIPPKTPRADKRNIPMKSAEGIRFTVDLHWNLFSYRQLRGSASGATSDGWRRATWHPDHPLGPMWQLPREMLVAFLTTHAVLDHRFRLILFRDLAEAAQSGLVDFDAFAEYVTRHELRSLAYTAWFIAAAAADAPVSDDVLADLRLSSVPVRATELWLSRVDPTTFDGHKPHPLNLAMVLLHDRRATRLRLAAAAPAAFPEWLKRVTPPAQPSVVRSLGPDRQRQARVMHLLPVDLARGAQTYAKAMRDALDSPEVEHRTTTIFESDSGSLVADVELGVPIGRGRAFGFSPRAFLTLYRFLRRTKPDVVIAHGGEALKYAAWAVQRQTKLVYYKIGTTDGLLQNPLRRLFHRALLHRSDLVAGVSQEMVDEVVNQFGVCAADTVYIPNGRDPAAFFEPSVKTEHESAVQFMFVGHLTRTKRPDFFAEVVTDLQKRGSDVAGVVVGDGPMLEHLNESSPNITYLGRRDDVPDLLASADVFLFTSVAEGEGMPGVLIEAGLAGLPTVSTDVPGARTVIADGQTGFVVAVNDPGRYVDCAAQLAESHALRMRMGAAARERCMEQFTLAGSLAAWQKQLSELLREAVTMTRSNRPTVLFVSANGGVGGPSRSLSTLLTHLAPRIRRVLYSPSNQLPGDDGDTWIPMAVSRRSPRIGHLLAAARFVPIAWKHRRDTLAIHANGQSELNVAGPGAVIARLPVVLWAHASQGSKSLRGLGRLWSRILPELRLAAVSPEARTVLEEAGLVSPDRQVSIIPNPIDPTEVVCPHRIANELITIGYLKGKSPVAGWSLLPDVIDYLWDLPVRWLLFTSAPSDPVPPHVAGAWSRLQPLVGPRVEMRGKVATVADAYAECDIVFIPSLQESFGRIAVEAMLNGLPVVGSDIPALRRLLGDSESGLLFPVGDAAGAADAIRRLVANPSLRERLGEHGRTRGAEYAPGPIVEQLMALYRAAGNAASRESPSATVDTS